MLKTDDIDINNNRNGFDYLRTTLSSSLSADSRSRIESLVQDVSNLKDIEKLLFCLLLPVDGPNQHSFLNASLGLHSEDTDISTHGFDLAGIGVGIFSPGGPSSLHLSNQVEQSQAYTWIMSHLEEDQTTCLRKDEVYEDYRAYCDKHHMKTLNTADFGKVMKRAFPNVKPRRLGQRGQSRYCYGGLRKKTEVQPPFLPDLTDETLGLTAARSTISPASSSGASGEVGSHRRLLSTSPLTRILQPNGTESTAWAEDASVKSALGVRGTIVSDVAHILLEYAHQVFGLTFPSLFQLAQHLVSNRYVNSRSRHAFSLIAHASANRSSTLSPPPSTALAEALQKGLTRSAFDRVGNGRLKSDTPDRSTSIKQESDHLKTDASQSPARYAPLKSTMSPNPQSINRTTANSVMSTPQASYKPYQPNFSPMLNAAQHTGHMYATAAALASQTVAQTSSPYALPSNQNSTQGLRHSSAAVALAAAAAAAARQHTSFTSIQQPPYGSSFSLAGQLSPGVTGSSFDAPPAAHEKPSFQTPSTPLTASVDNPYLSSYLSPVNHSTTYTAHQQNSPYSGLQQPPAPLPPGVGARSPYTPMANPTTGISEHSGYKRSLPPHPVEAPGAYEPSPRFHLGGQSPNKRARYLSNASGSSGTSSSECPPPLSTGSAVDNTEPYGDGCTPAVTMTNNVPPSPTSSGGSGHSVSSHHAANQFSTRSEAGLTCAGSSMTSPYYSSRYEGLEMRSPAPHVSVANQLPRLPKLTGAPNAWTVNANSNSTVPQANYHSPASISSSCPTTVFRPPITPFALELDDEDEFTNLPRLGASPGPQIPPSSPTEFLPFYSEAASKSAKVKGHLSVLAGHDLDEVGSGRSLNSPKKRGTYSTSDSHLETPPSSALMMSTNGLGTLNSPGSSSNSDDDSHDRTLTNFSHLGQVNTPPMPGLGDAPSPSETTGLVRRREELQNELSTPDPTEASPIHMKPESASSHSSSADVSITAF